MARTDQELNMLLAHYERLKNAEQDMLMMLVVQQI